MPVTLLPISFAAASSSAGRRPGMNTYAPSATNRFAVARPMPLLPPVTSAILPSSFPLIVIAPYLALSKGYVGKAAHLVFDVQKTSARTSILSRGAALGGLLG